MIKNEGSSNTWIYLGIGISGAGILTTLVLGTISLLGANHIIGITILGTGGSCALLGGSVLSDFVAAVLLLLVLGKTLSHKSPVIEVLVDQPDAKCGAPLQPPPSPPPQATPSLEEVFSEEVLLEIYKNLNVKDLKSTALVSSKGRALAHEAILAPAKRYGYEGNDGTGTKSDPKESKIEKEIENAKKYLDALFKDLHIFFKDEFFPIKQFVPFMKTDFDLEENIKKLDSLTEDELKKLRPKFNARLPGYVREGKIGILRFFLKHGADPNYQAWVNLDVKESPLLSIAIEKGRWDIAKLLLEYKADPRLRNCRGDTSLHCAAAMGASEILKLILEREDARDPGKPLESLSSINNYRDTPLHKAVRWGHKACVELLLKYGADPQHQNSMHFTPRRMTTSKEIIALLDSERTPLHYAASSGDKSRVEKLIASGANLLKTSKAGHIPLEDALAYPEIVALMLPKIMKTFPETGSGFSTWINQLVGGQSLLHKATNKEYLEGKELLFLESAELLLDHGANAFARSCKGNTPLHNAAYNGHIGIVEALLRREKELSPRVYSIHYTNLAGRTPLHSAAMQNHKKIVELFLKEGADPNFPDSAGKTPLELATDAEIIELLKAHAKETPARLPSIESVKPPQAAQVNEDAPQEEEAFAPEIMRARSYGYAGNDIAKAQEFLDSLLSDLKLFLIDEYYPIKKHFTTINLDLEANLKKLESLSEAGRLILRPKLNAKLRGYAREGKVGILALFLKLGADPTLQDEKGETPLFYAVRAGQMDIVRLLLKGDGQKLINHKNHNRYTPLHVALLSGKVKTAKILIEHKADLHLKNSYGNTPLNVAAFEGHAEIIELILQREKAEGGGQIPLLQSPNNRGEIPLHFAVIFQHKLCVELLLEWGSDPTYLTGEGYTPKQLAKNNHEIIALLDSGWTPLHYAVAKGRKDRILELLQSGATTLERNNKGATPLHLAAQKDDVEIVELLLQDDRAPYLMKCTDMDGRTPFHLAVLSGPKLVVELLLKEDADPDFPDARGQTPLELTKNREREIAALLRARSTKEIM